MPSRFDANCRRDVGAAGPRHEPSLLRGYVVSSGEGFNSSSVKGWQTVEWMAPRHCRYQRRDRERLPLGWKAGLQGAIGPNLYGVYHGPRFVDVSCHYEATRAGRRKVSSR